jgi:hypothetical protein
LSSYKIVSRFYTLDLRRTVCVNPGQSTGELYAVVFDLEDISGAIEHNFWAAQPENLGGRTSLYSLTFKALGCVIIEGGRQALQLFVERSGTQDKDEEFSGLKPELLKGYDQLG